MRYIKLKKRKKLDNRMMHGALMLTTRERDVLIDLIGHTNRMRYHSKERHEIRLQDFRVIQNLYCALNNETVSDES